MTTEQSIVLSGERVLPISIVTERFPVFSLRTVSIEAAAAERMLCTSAIKSVERDMISGTVLRQTCDCDERPNVYCGDICVEANEMIAVESSIRMITGDINDGARNQRGTNGAAD